MTMPGFAPAAPRLRRRGLRFLVFSLLGLLHTACVVPIVRPAGTEEIELSGFPRGSEAVAIAVESGLELRGVFVPAEPGAPVVLHLLPSQASVTTGLTGVAGWKQTLEVLQDHGYASLAIDYRGVGASDGDPDPAALAADAEAIWQEALERAGGRSGDLVLRAASLGTIPASALLEAGHTPRCLILFAPIRVETIARHAPMQRHGTFLGAIAGFFLRRPPGPDLSALLRNTEVPVLLIAAREDGYLPDEERALLFEAARSNGHQTVLFDGDHMELVSRAYGFEWGDYSGRLIEHLLPAEADFLETCAGR